jgi:hypothetical protein
VIPASEIERSVVNSISRIGFEQVLVATSGMNAFVGEPVPLEIRWFPNPIVLRKGDLVAESRIDGTLSSSDVLAQITEFFRKSVRSKAHELGMVPVLGQESTFGSVSNEDLLALLSSIKEANRRIRLLAFAGQDTRAGDPLRLEFRLR